MNYARYQDAARSRQRRYYARNRETILAKRRAERDAARHELYAFEDANAGADHNLDCDPPWCTAGCGCLPCRLGKGLALDPDSKDYRQWQEDMRAAGVRTHPRYT